MLDVKRFEVSSFAINHTILEWEIAPTFEHLSNYIFEIHRSETPEAGWKQIAVLQDVYYFEDKTINLYSQHRKWYYKLVVRNIIKDKEKVFGPISWPTVEITENIPIAREIIRRNDLLLRNYIGRQAVILKRRTFGEHCDACYDKIKKTVISSKCKVCYKTGYKGGYYKPIKVFIGTPNPDIEQVQIQDIGVIEKSDTTFWTGIFPLLTPGDLIIFKNTHKRYRIVDIQMRTIIQGSPIHQLITAREIPHNDIEYSIPVMEFNQIPLVRRMGVYKYQVIENYNGSPVRLEYAANLDNVMIFCNSSLVSPDCYFMNNAGEVEFTEACQFQGDTLIIISVEIAQ